MFLVQYTFLKVLPKNIFKWSTNIFFLYTCQREFRRPIFYYFILRLHPNINICSVRAFNYCTAHKNTKHVFIPYLMPSNQFNLVYFKIYGLSSTCSLAVMLLVPQPSLYCIRLSLYASHFILLRLLTMTCKKKQMNLLLVGSPTDFYAHRQLLVVTLQALVLNRKICMYV